MKRIAGLRYLHYWDRLMVSRMSSTEQRVDCYRVLYTWKIIQGLVPNCGIQWATSGRRGLQVKIPPISGSRMAIRTLRDRSFMTEALHLYNSLPVHLREFSGSLASFKAALDDVLSSVPDTPLSDTRRTFATDLLGSPSNSLRDWLQAISSSNYSRLIHETAFGSVVPVLC